MIICVNSCWNEPSGKTETHDNITLVFNQYHKDASLVIDIKDTRSPLSAQFPPEARIWVHLEPIKFTSYFCDFEKYYAGGILSWHKPLRVLPQFRDYRQGGKGFSGKFDEYATKKFGIGGLISHKKTREWKVMSYVTQY